MMGLKGANFICKGRTHNLLAKERTKTLMDYQDKTLTCKDCSKEFVWSAGEQKFYADKGLQNPPGRCPDCRKQKKEQKANRQMFAITCKKCGKEGEVPFQPRNPNDVLCAECFAAEKTNSQPAE